MKLFFVPILGLILAGCAGKEEYTPAPGATGEDIFKTACAECHEPKEHGKFFELSKEKANPSAIAKTVSKGGFFMPSFPNISGDSLETLSEYVLTISKVE
ncbi:MAG TPA: cytochrome c [Gammaproteobacteria bacterium]|nr:cytochrome c [Gammaproteobacteria bacterium]